MSITASSSTLRPRNKGFSLLEVLFTIVIILVGLLSLHAMTILAVQSISVSKKISTAVSLAQVAMEQMEESGYRSAVSHTEAYGTLQGHPHFQRTVEVVEGEPEPGTKTVNVTVAWDNDIRGGEKSVTLTGILSDR